MDKNYRVVFAAERVAKIEECPMPGELQPGQVLIKADVSQISTGTELSMLIPSDSEPESAWVRSRSNFPVYPGYSNSGTVVAVGADVDPSYVGKHVMAVVQHQKYYVRELKDCVFMADSVDQDEAVFSTLGAVTLASIRVSRILPGDAVVVYGAGIVGQLTARFAKVAGAVKVFVVDLSEYRLGLLPDDPCFTKVNPANVEDIPQFIKDHNNGNLARVVFETTGNQHVIPSELNCVAKCGKFIITSSPKGKSAIDFDFVSCQGITIIGAHNMTIHPPVATNQNPWTFMSELPYFIEMLEKEQISVKNLITHHYNYKDAADAYNMLMADRGSAMAAHLVWND